MSHKERLGRYTDVSTALALRSDQELADWVRRGHILGRGIGGTSLSLDIVDTPVFAKQVPLTDTERRADHVRSTANLFGLPAFCQYGVGSPGFGAWRELAAHTMATNWVLAGRTAAFPMLYHWRVLPGSPALAEEHVDVESAVQYWDGSPAVRERLQALAHASVSLVLFQELIPHRLSDWLATQVDAGPDAVTSACGVVESRLLAAVAFMNANGLMHFDAHFGNIVTDGDRLYFTDLGLAASPRFDLSAQEVDFLARNRTHDLAYAMMRLVNWLVADVCGVAAPPDGAPLDRNGFIRACAAGAEPTGVPSPVAAVIRRYAPVAVVMNDFYGELFGVSRATPYPAEKVERALSTIPDLA